MGEQQVEAAAPLRCVEQLASGRALCGLGSVCGGAFWAKAAYRLKAGVVSAARRQEERERTHAPRHHHMAKPNLAAVSGGEKERGFRKDSAAVGCLVHAINSLRAKRR